jgi:carbon-monoxide dehydrogenase large subunit
MVTGTATYLDDIEPRGTLRCAVLRSARAAGRIVGIDMSALERIEGVRAVLTIDDALAEMVAPMPHIFDPANVGGNTAVFYPFVDDQVRYVGQPVLAIAADTLSLAEDALALVTVEYEDIDPILDVASALAPGARKIFDHWSDNAVCRFPFGEGDADAALARSPHTITTEIDLQRYYTAPMETRGYIAEWNRRGTRLVFHSNTQMPHPERSHLATAFGMAESNIRVISPRVGGGFGHKFHGYEETFIVALLARKAGAPVKWLETRHDSMLVGAREFKHEVTVGFDDDGRLLALKDRVHGDVGALGPWGGWCMTFPAATTIPGPYKLTDYSVETIPVVTNKPPWSGARGYGKESACVALERTLDRVAAYLGLDPATVRLRNFIQPEEFPYWTIVKTMDSGDYPGALAKVMSMADYAALEASKESARREGRLVGVAVAMEVTAEGADFTGSFFRGYDTSTVRVDPSGSVTVLTGVTTPGSGNDLAIAQIVAHEFGISADRVQVVQGDTESCPYGFGNFSSRSVTTGGAAAALAAREVKERMALVAGAMLSRDPAGFTFADGGLVHAEDSSAVVSFFDVADQVYRRTVPLVGDAYPQLEATRSAGPDNYQWSPDDRGGTCMYPTYSSSAHVCSVEVDPDTGHTKILSYHCVDDCGVVINPDLVKGQLQGAIGQGIGGALMEHIKFDSQGHLLTGSLKEYIVPRALDLPNVVVGSQVTPSPFTTLGTKGAGESGVGGSLAAIAGAINDALSPLGVEINEFPLSPPRIREAMRKATTH